MVRRALFGILALLAVATVEARDAREAPVAAERPPTAKGPELWTCGMHPQVVQDRPGKCPICGMELTPLRDSAPRQAAQPADETAAAGPAVHVDPAVVQNMGIRTATVVEGPLRRTIRAAGYLGEAEPLQHDVNLRVSGWIEKLHADTEGQHVEAGDPLFDLYSPELRVGIEELIAARRAADVAARAGLTERTQRQLETAALRKLELWGLPEREVRRLAAADTAPRTVTFTSPVRGHLVEKEVVAGAAVKAGDRVMRIVDHSTLWLDIQIYERNLPGVGLGDAVRASVAGRPGEVFEGTITFLHPHVDPMTRTVMARAAIANESLHLRPGMYATAEITGEIAASARLVPREAIIDTGVRQVAFVAGEAGHFTPRHVAMGAAAEDGMVQVLSGLEPGEVVVTSGQFLLDAESRMREAIQKLLSERTGATSDAGVAPSVPHVH